jgi:uncharacterized membrane protein
MNRFMRFWLNINASLWFLPVLLVALFLALALGLVLLDRNIDHSWEHNYPLLFGAGAEAARSILAALASSMITVAALTFTLTLTTLAQVSNQYSPRVVWIFMRDRGNQFVLGSFLGILPTVWWYCVPSMTTTRSSLFLP